MFGTRAVLRRRLRQLERHLKRENPLLVQAVKRYRKLDKLAHRLGLLRPDQSYAAQIPWWPLISLLGTFSAGKSSFVNYYLGDALQDTGTQAVDDKFTVICYGGDETARVLPGIALDADPRYPFYQMSEELEKVAPGEGAHIDSYVQMKTTSCERLQGKILIDSPGFDADAQRTATLRITDYIIDLSDLVLVFFDARHPEPGAMRDTLTHLVGKSISRSDASKFLYVLNQLDVTAREDNPEDVVGAWQRALAQEGLTAGRFYTIYNPQHALTIEDPNRRARFEAKRDEDLAEIEKRMEDVGEQRAYRIVANLEKTARSIEEVLVPQLYSLKARWRQSVAWRSALLFGGLLATFLVVTISLGYWQGLQFQPPGWQWLNDNPWRQWGVGLAVAAGLSGLYFQVRAWAARAITRRIAREQPDPRLAQALQTAFRKNTRPWYSVFNRRPVGWNRSTHRQLKQLYADADQLVQALNNRYAAPSGETGRSRGPVAAVASGK